MTRETIITELQNRGYNAEQCDTVKNGVILEAIRIATDNSIIAPVIYTEGILEQAETENRTLNEVVATIIGIYESNKTVDFNIENFLERDFILNHIYIGLQKVSTEDIVKQNLHDFEGIESYLYIRQEKGIGKSYSIKATEFLLARVNISKGEAWERATENTNAETTVESMAKVMANMLGFEYSEEMDEEIPLFVISNTSRVKGASAILNREMLAEFGRRYNTDKIVVLPSSIHEMLLIPYVEETNIDDFSSMVGEVNSTEVDPTEQLTDRAYIISL